MDRISYFQKTLECRRDELETRILDIEDRLDDQMELEFEKKPAERQDEQILEKQLRNAYREFQCVYSALNRIKVKTFGRCISCRKEISDERLKAEPHTMFCRNCIPLD